MSTMVRKHKCQVAMVDYLQAMGCSTREDDRRHAMRVSSARVKAAGMRLGCVTVAFTQLTTADGDELSEPSIESTRDCKDITMQASTSIVLWRKEKSMEALLFGKVEKSKADGLGTRFAMRRGPGGSLEECALPEEYAAGGYRAKRGGR